MYLQNWSYTENYLGLKWARVRLHGEKCHHFLIGAWHRLGTLGILLSLFRVLQLSHGVK